jgi:hypothetical protein
MDRWAPGYSQSQLDAAQERYDLQFPPDLIELFLERRPTNGYDWHTEDPRIREMLVWPFDLLLFDVEQGFWWPDWGERPSSQEERREVLQGVLGGVSRLIPLYAHRFLPETPSLPGNPVFSMHGFDTVCYGADLADYFEREFDPMAFHGVPVAPSVRHIPFWSDIVEHFDVAYSYYAKHAR